MSNELPKFRALNKLGDMVEQNIFGSEVLLKISELEIQAERVRQQEIGNWIAVAMNPTLFPFQQGAAAARVAALTGIETGKASEGQA